MKKRCSKCKQDKILKEFGVKKLNKDGLNHYCKLCENVRGKLKYVRTKEQKKYYQITKLYGLTKEQYLIKLEQQDFKCAICETTLLNDRNTHIDHDHKSGKVRDILCKNCNLILGKVNEDTTYLLNIVGYIYKHV